MQLGISAFVVEGITFLLLQPGAGVRAQRIAVAMAAAFAVVSSHQRRTTVPLTPARARARSSRS
jgi:hypothetical protein